MDAVEEVQNLHRYFPFVNASFVIVPDPFYAQFDNGLKIYKGEALILTVWQSHASDIMHVGNLKLM